MIQHHRHHIPEQMELCAVAVDDDISGMDQRHGNSLQPLIVIGNTIVSFPRHLGIKIIPPRLNIQPPAITTLDRVIDLVPQLLDRAEAFIDKKNAPQASPAADSAAVEA